MFKKVWTIFLRDVKVNTRDFLAVYIILFPILFAIGINLLTPSINDTTVNLALLKEDIEAATYLRDFAKVETFDTVEAVEDRVAKRDNMIGILPKDDGYYVLQQGNEAEGILDYAKVLITLYEQDAQIEDSTAVIEDFDRATPPLKKMLVNIAILFTSVLGGMLIAFNIVEEKVDRTIRAIHLSPVSRNVFILGKSLMGITLPIYGTLAIVLITGYTTINFGQMLLLVIVSSILSMLVGFIEGIKSEDIITAASSVKMLFLPLAAAIAAIELLSEQWQILFYPIPFYWAYKGNDAVLAASATWGQIILYTVITFGLSAIVYIYLAPKIKKGLQ
ncbi:ABC transporter permease [Vallitalea pronyensis]|uniref:ABC transporter permease n=1 Tax=Vallitalea pronyensis TaxID=1348613 RepID=A0A8J8MIQ5_9FIRM|nr:ABC transporter permease [Vallitalea pronyensis]QUI22374.1 ABC transporter permease [Vallitalea pronyensis]